MDTRCFASGDRGGHPCDADNFLNPAHTAADIQSGPASTFITFFYVFCSSSSSAFMLAVVSCDMLSVRRRLLACSTTERLQSPSCPLVIKHDMDSSSSHFRRLVIKRSLSSFLIPFLVFSFWGSLFVLFSLLFSVRARALLFPLRPL